MTGYNSHHLFNWRDAPFTAFWRGDKITFGSGAGLALQEIMFLENLGRLLQPKNCLIIGNSYGWSTVATALTFPGAKTVGIDSMNEDGIRLTVQLFETLKLKGVAVLAESPNDVARVCTEQFDGQVDFVLIDALHTNDAMTKDFQGVLPHCTEDCVFLFHDVINLKMIPAFNYIIKNSNLSGCILTKTASGMAIAYAKGELSKDFEEYVQMFSDVPDIYKQYRLQIAQRCDEMKAIYDDFSDLSM